MSTSTVSTENPIKVAIAGPSGRLGSLIITRFLLSTTPTFHVTILTRSASTDKTTTLIQEITTQHTHVTPPTIVPINEVDYTNATSLTQHLTSQSALIILLNRNVLEPQLALIDAAIAAGVSHIIPSSFGVGTHHAYIRSNPATREKVVMEDHLRSRITSQTPSDSVTTFTCINTGIFLDYAMPLSIFISLTPSRPTFVFDDGTAKLAATTYDDIATSIFNGTTLGIARDPRVLNNDLYVQTCSISQSQLLSYAKNLAPNREFPVVNVNTLDAERESIKKVEQGDISPETVRGFLVRASFGLGLGEFRNIDNGVLGVEERGEEWVREMVGSYLQGEE